MTYAKIAEYRDIDGAPRSIRTTINTRTKEGREYRLISATAGYECAGSMARWTENYWSVEFSIDGTRNGRRFSSRSKAEELFDTWTLTHTLTH